MLGKTSAMIVTAAAMLNFEQCFANSNDWGDALSDAAGLVPGLIDACATPEPAEPAMCGASALALGVFYVADGLFRAFVLHGDSDGSENCISPTSHLFVDKIREEFNEVVEEIKQWRTYVNEENWGTLKASAVRVKGLEETMITLCQQALKGGSQMTLSSKPLGKASRNNSWSEITATLALFVTLAVLLVQFRRRTVLAIPLFAPTYLQGCGEVEPGSDPSKALLIDIETKLMDSMSATDAISTCIDRGCDDDEYGTLTTQVRQDFTQIRSDIKDLIDLPQCRSASISMQLKDDITPIGGNVSMADLDAHLGRLLEEAKTLVKDGSGYGGKGGNWYWYVLVGLPPTVVVAFGTWFFKRPGNAEIWSRPAFLFGVMATLAFAVPLLVVQMVTSNGSATQSDLLHAQMVEASVSDAKSGVDALLTCVAPECHPAELMRLTKALVMNDVNFFSFLIESSLGHV